MKISFANTSPISATLNNPFESVGSGTPPKSTPSTSLATADSMTVLRGNKPVQPPIQTKGPQIENGNVLVDVIVDVIKDLLTRLSHNCSPSPVPGGYDPGPDNNGDGGGESPLS